MRSSTFAIVLLLLSIVAVAVSAANNVRVATFTAAVNQQPKGSILGSDGKTCFICVLALTIVQQSFHSGGMPPEAALSTACDEMPDESDFRDTCKAIINDIGSTALTQLETLDPDSVCSNLGLCKNCHLDPTADLTVDADAFERQTTARLLAGLLEFSLSIGKPFNNNEKVVPTMDLDGDYFSSMHSAKRGADWRGKDCNDLSRSVRPGRKASDESVHYDLNCNGIKGANKQGQGYEQLLCGQSNARTLLFFGDSASAGFSIRSDWVYLKNISQIPGAFQQEFDWPQDAWTSGWSDATEGKSINLYMRQNNLCNHRDFQSVAKNGATMASLSQFQIQSIDVIQNVTNPVSAIIGYIGNDVCANTLEEMTTPASFQESLLKGLAMLDEVLPPGSHVALLGLVDGRVLWNEMHDLPHPIGGVTYAQFYNFLSCTGSNPCHTWLNSNETMRNLTSARAMELNSILEQTVAANKASPQYRNFDLAYLDFAELLADAFAVLAAQGIPSYNLINRVDGFHPSIEYGHRTLAEVVWRALQEDFPEFIGPANPNNAQIAQLFGDQGGF